jgi:hypothetical protein
MRPATAEGEKIDSTPVDAFAILRDGIAGARWAARQRGSGCAGAHDSRFAARSGDGFFHRYSSLSASGRAVSRLIC